MSVVPTLRTITLTEGEAETIFKILAACVDETHLAMSDDELVEAIELRDRFRPVGGPR